MLDKVRTIQPENIRNQLFINGEFVDAEDGSTIDVLNPHDGSKITAIAEAKPVDVDKAVAAARGCIPRLEQYFRVGTRSAYYEAGR